MATLLEKAKSVVIARPFIPKEEITDEHIELILAYLNNEITVRQASAAMGHKYAGNFTAWLGKAVKTLYQQKKIQILK